MAFVLSDLSGGVAVLTINRPDVRNAFDRATADEFRSALQTAVSHRDVGAVIVTGAGEASFMAGADLRRILNYGRADALDAESASLLQMVERCPKPTIAAVNGAALGGGCELALACDIRIAADHATFGLPEVSRGIIPAAGATYRLPATVGIGRAKWMILTGQPIDAHTALQWGLVTAVVGRERLLAEARALGERLLQHGPFAVRAAKVALNASCADRAPVIESLAQALCFESRDKVEGITAFCEKRPPKFTGE